VRDSGSHQESCHAPRYFVPDLVGPLTRLKYRHIDKREPLPDFPVNVQIQTISGCNGNCIFCPNMKTELEIPMGRSMDMDLFRRIVDQLVAQPTVKRISPYLMNEPLLDKHLPERVKHITDRKQPHQYTKINSHGNSCNEGMAKGLLDAGLTRINSSVQGIDPAIYERVMHLKFKKTVENIERMVRLRNEGRHKTRIRVVMLDTTEIHDQIPAIERFWAERGVKIHINQLENRGHHSHIKSDTIAVRPAARLRLVQSDVQPGLHPLGRPPGHVLRRLGADGDDGRRLQGQRRRHLDGAQAPRVPGAFPDRQVRGMLCDGYTKDGEDDED